MTLVFWLKTLNDLCSAIRRTIINDQHMKILLQAKNSSKNIRNILLFIVSRYNDKFLQKCWFQGKRIYNI